MNCPKCSGNVPILNLPSDVKRKVIDTVRKGNRLQAVIELKNLAQVDLSQAKAAVFHLTHEYDLCHKCRAQLTEQNDEQICSKCHSLNLNWK